MRCAVFLTLVALAITPASAGVVFDNGAPAADFAPSYPLTQSVQAEDFTLSEGSVITGLRFYGLERLDGYAGSIYWSIRNDELGQPSVGEIAGDTTSAVTRTLTGVLRPDHFGAPESIYGIEIAPLALGAGTYWLVLHNGPLSHDDVDNAQGFFLWEGSMGRGGAAGVEDARPFDGAWQQTSAERSFQLVAVPEPGALVPLSGWANMFLRRRRDNCARGGSPLQTRQRTGRPSRSL